MFLKSNFFIKSGDGGNGCISYLKIKNKIYCDGGNGGNGGNVYLLSNNNFKFIKKNFLKSENGYNGKSKKKNGLNGKDLIIKLPIGSLIKFKYKKIFLTKNNFFIKILLGGNGGKGNFFIKKKSKKKIAEFGFKGKIIYCILIYKFFLNKCYIFLCKNYYLLNNFNFNKTFISKIYIFYINFYFFLKLIKFFLYFLFLKNFNKNNYWIVINLDFKTKLIKIRYIINPFFFISNFFLFGFKKIFHYLILWKNS